MAGPRSVVIVGESIAGVTAARELRNLGYRGRVTLVGDEAHGAYARPPLSKAVLTDSAADSTLAYSYADLDVEVCRSPAIALDTTARLVSLADATTLDYDALIIATGASPRRLAEPGQQGELVLRTLDDARELRTRIREASTALVVGAGFLGMEVASACVAQGVAVTVVDVDLPLQRILGDFISSQIIERAADHGVRFVQATGAVRLAGDPVRGVVFPNGATLVSDVVVTCAGDTPATEWLDGTGLAGPRGVPVDWSCATSVPGVFAAGDVAHVRRGSASAAQRAPFLSNAVAQAKVAAASVLGLEATSDPRDDYFWSEILKLPIKVVGPLPLSGAPTTVDGNLQAGDALLTWHHPDGRVTVAAYGRRVPVPRLRALAR